MKRLFIVLIILVLMIGGAAYVGVRHLLADLPDVSILKRYRPATAAQVLDKDGNLLFHLYDNTFRVWVPISSLPKVVIQAVVTAEDDTFFQHHGVNYQATWDALKRDVEKRRFARGGSTITQQMIKNTLLSKEKTIVRKLREYVLARQAEEILTKRRILEIYLNEVEWGDDINGIEAASRYYLGKHASELTPAEAALFASMLPNPHYYEPFKRFDETIKRQRRVLLNMRNAGLLKEDEYARALAQPIKLNHDHIGMLPSADKKNRPCYQSVLEQALLSIHGENALYRGGLIIRTTLDRDLQERVRSFDRPVRENLPATVNVIQQGTVVRAMLCADGNESELKEKLAFGDGSNDRLEISSVSVGALARDQIVQQ